RPRAPRSAAPRFPAARTRPPPRPGEPSRCTRADPAGRAGVLTLRTWIATGYGTRFGRGTGTISTAPARVYYKLLGHLVQRRSEALHRAVHVGELVQAEQPDAEGGEVFSLAALQRHTGRHLHTGAGEGRPGADLRVVGVGDHHCG